MQLGTPHAYLGRVTGLMSLDFSLWSLGAMLAGAVADRLAQSFAGASGRAAGSADLARPPSDAVAQSLSATLAGTAVVCLAAVLLLARPILRDGRLDASPESGES